MTYPNVVALQSKAHRLRIKSRGLNQMSVSSVVTLPAPLVNTKGESAVAYLTGWR
jgi:hypothetical protein